MTGVRRLRRAALALAGAACLAQGSGAQTTGVPSTFERFEATTVAMTERLYAALVAQIPALEGNLPAADWDAPMREAYTCMYDAYVAEAGEDAVGGMVAEFEALRGTITDAELLDGRATVQNPDGMSDERALEIVTDCRVMVVFIQRMAESGAAEIMMQRR